MSRKYQKSYAFIDSTNIRRCDYEVKREFAFNDYDNVYYQKGFENIDVIFESNGVPEKLFLNLKELILEQVLKKFLLRFRL